MATVTVKSDNRKNCTLTLPGVGTVEFNEAGEFETTLEKANELFECNLKEYYDKAKGPNIIETPSAPVKQNAAPAQLDISNELDEDELAEQKEAYEKQINQIWETANGLVNEISDFCHSPIINNLDSTLLDKESLATDLSAVKSSLAERNMLKLQSSLFKLNTSLFAITSSAISLSAVKQVKEDLLEEANKIEENNSEAEKNDEQEAVDNKELIASLPDLTRVKLEELCKPFPGGEWRGKNKEGLIIYLTEKLSA